MTRAAVPATALHAEAMAMLHAEVFPPAERWPAPTFATQLDLPGVFGFICPRAGMVLARIASDSAEILTIAVLPAARRRGHGRALLHAAEARAAAAGAETMFLEVSMGNLAARALYAAAGYRQVGRRARYYPDGTDALVLARSLNPGATTDG